MALMELTVTLMSGESHPVQVGTSATVGELKLAAAKIYEEKISSVRLFTNNGSRVALDNSTALLSSFGLSSGSTVLLQILKSFQVFVSNPGGKSKTYDVNEEETVDDLQTKIYNKEKIPKDQQWLSFSSKPLEAGKKLKDYNITSGSTIHSNLRLRGG